MSNQWFYNCDGRTGGPISHVQLQLMVNSGLLLAHHVVRRGDMPNWLPAGSVRGLFATAAPANIPQAMPVAPASPAPVDEPTAADESPFGFLAAPGGAASDGPPTGVFDFFGEAGPKPMAPPPPPPKPAAKPAKPARKPAEPPPAPIAAPPAEPEIIDLPLVEPEPAGAGNPFAFNPAAAAQPLASTPAVESPVVEQPEPETPMPGPKAAESAPAALPEVTGTPVDLFGDAVRPLEGKTSFRLHRAWLLAVSKFAGGASRSVYLRLQRLDGATLEHRYEAGPGRKGPHAVLCFHAGDVQVALSFTGSDKPYRAFLEKVLHQSNSSSKHTAART